MRIGVVVNPASGRGSGAKAWPRAENRLRSFVPDLTVVETTSPGSAKRQAHDLACAGCDIVAAAGGDGTVRDVMEGVLGTDAALAILPFGTGNDFSRHLGFGCDLDLAMSALVAGERKRVDVGRWRRGAQEGYFLNVAGCGFDAAVADRINRGFRRIRGTTAYLAAVIRTLATYRASTLNLCIDGESKQVRAMLCAFANASSYGGGMKVAPSADIADGFLDMVLVRELGRLEFLLAFPQVFKGTHLTHPKVEHRRFKSLTVEASAPVPFLVDGEVLGPGPLVIDVLPRALEVMALEVK